MADEPCKYELAPPDWVGPTYFILHGETGREAYYFDE